MVRLTADLIWKSPHFFNAIKERELDLRGNKIAVIENLGATEDQFDTIDLSDNEIVKLENFPYMNRLGTLLVNNNRITRINPNLGEFLPKLHTLVLTNNRLTNLAEIDPLASLPKLQYLSLLDNTVTKQPDYRLYVIHKLKHLRLLDFKKVKQQVVYSFPLEWLQIMFWNGPRQCWQQKGQTSSSFDFVFSLIRCMHTMSFG
ncbi:hypothetical protein SEVIR_9G009000v4 [Setaria viridis]